MLTAEERVMVLHKRMEERRRKREQLKTGVMGMISGGIAVCLLILVFGKITAHCGGTAGTYSGATMLFDDVGGYALVGVVSFAVAVIVTSVCMRRQQKQKGHPTPDNDNQPEEKRL